MSRTVNWAWERHLGEEAASLQNIENAIEHLYATIAQAEDDLQIKMELRDAIIKRAKGRARKANDKKPEFRI